MRVYVTIALDLDDPKFFELRDTVRKRDRPTKVQLHSRDMPAQHLGDGFITGIRTDVGDGVGGK